jgi:hypothetical protein
MKEHYMSEDDFAKFKQMVADALVGNLIPFVHFSMISKYFTKDFCDSIGVHYFDYTLHELLKNPSRMCTLSVMKEFGLEREFLQWTY